MAMELFLLGTSQSVASAGLRERMHVDLDEVYAGLVRIREIPGLLEEAVPVGTCGRLEVYGLSERPLRAVRVLKDLLSAHTGIPREELDAHSYVRWGEDAARHLFRVASGLDSVIFGEAQILGQVREAMAHPATPDVAGTFMMRLFQTALAAGKRVRSETEIGRGSASVAGAGLCLLEAEIGDFDGKCAVVLGAGDTGVLVARLLRKAGVTRLHVVNRTVAKAERVARELGGAAHGLGDIGELLPEADILVGAIGQREDLVTADMMRGLTGTDRRKRYLLDLAHPRNFAAELASVPGVRVMDLEEVFARVEQAKVARATQVPRAEAIVDEEVEGFAQWVRSRQSAPVLRAVRERVLALAQAEAERRGKGKSSEEREELALFARSLARTLLYAPTAAIREADPATPEGEWLLRTAPAIFGLADEQAAEVAR